MTFSYTAHNNPEIDETIENHMKIVTEELTKSMAVDSILLAGGFGRGEGTVRRLPDGKYVPMNDYDLYILSNTEITYEQFQVLKKRLVEKTGVEMDLKIAKTDRLKYLIPDMFTFELKVASRVISGRDLRAKIPIERSDVPLSAGLNTLFLESVALSLYFEPCYMNGEAVIESKAPMFDYVCSKVFVEIGDALSLLGKFYDPSLIKRAKFLLENYEVLFPELSESLPDLAMAVQKATTDKLTCLNFGTGKLLDKWLDAREALKFTMAYFLSRVLNKPVDPSTLSNFLIANRRQVARFYFGPYVDYAFRRVRLPKMRLLKTSVDPAVRIYENLRYLKNYYHSERSIFFGAFVHFESPLIDIYVSSVSLMLAIEEKNQINEKMLENAFRMLRLVNSPVKVKDFDDKNWSKLRNACLSSFKTYSSTPETLSF